MGEPTAYSRRRLLGTVGAGALVATSGCVRQTRSVVNRATADNLSLSISTVPADVDRESVMIARQFAETLEDVGIDSSIELFAAEEFPRQVMVNHDFDLFVARYPGDWDPDALYEALHSSFAAESGWQNPFGFTQLAFDELLEVQRELDGEERQEGVSELLWAFAQEQPFVPLCVPREQRLVREDRITGWEGPLSGRHGYLGLEVQPADVHDDGTVDLRAVTTDPRPTKNLNPISAEYRDHEPFTDLLYDSLASYDGEQLQPWLAAEWEWDEADTEAATTAMTVTLRRDLRWHDDVELTADDVAFTYRFLQDTSLGESEPPAPAPQFQSHAQAVIATEVVDDRTLTIAFRTGQEAAERALTVPVLPEHIWKDRAETARVRSLATAPDTTTALVTDNVPAIGSGSFRFHSRDERNSLVLERVADHFTTATDSLPEATVDRIIVHIDPRSGAAIESLEGASADVTTSALEAVAVERVTETEELRLLSADSPQFYCVGFNTRRDPFGNPAFRQTVGRLLDKAWLAETIFEGYAAPTAMPVASEWVPTELQWDNGDPTTPFFGTNGSGQIDVSAARDAFEGAGFGYDGDGRLVVRG